MAVNVDLEEALLGPLVAGRECAGCAVCCDVLRIDTADLEKPAGVRCIHSSPRGCAIHTDRPDVCRTWFCGWRRIEGMPDAARPDLSGLMVSLDIVREPRNCLEGVAIVVRSVAGRDAFESDLAEDMLDRLCAQWVPVWLHDGSQKVLIHPDADVAHHVITGDPAPPHLQEEVAAWRSRYGMFG